MNGHHDGGAYAALLDILLEQSGVYPELVRTWLAPPDAAPHHASATVPPGLPPEALRWLLLLQQSRLDALQALQARLAQRAAAGQPVARLRELYDLWVECAEQAHARLLCDPEFSRTCGELLNTWLALAPSTETA